ncbi:hypothetical protein ECPA4_0981, partial [Escherichia coli PA4]
QASLNFNS